MKVIKVFKIDVNKHGSLKALEFINIVKEYTSLSFCLFHFLHFILQGQYVRLLV